MSLHLLLDLVNSIHNLETVFETHILEYLFNIVSFLHLASRPKLLLYKQTPDPIFLCPWITSKHCFNLTKEMTAHAGCFLARTRIHVLHVCVFFLLWPALVLCCPYRFHHMSSSAHWIPLGLTRGWTRQQIPRWKKREMKVFTHLFPPALTWLWQSSMPLSPQLLSEDTPIHPPTAQFPLLWSF